MDKTNLVKDIADVNAVKESLLKAAAIDKMDALKAAATDKDKVVAECKKENQDLKTKYEAAMAESQKLKEQLTQMEQTMKKDKEHVLKVEEENQKLEKRLKMEAE